MREPPFDGLCVGALQHHQVRRFADHSAGHPVIDLYADLALLSVRLERPPKRTSHPAFEGRRDSLRVLVLSRRELLVKGHAKDLVDHTKRVTDSPCAAGDIFYP